MEMCHVDTGLLTGKSGSVHEFLLRNQAFKDSRTPSRVVSIISNRETLYAIYIPGSMRADHPLCRSGVRLHSWR